MPGGQDGQLGFKTESVVGTAVVVDKFLPITSESIKNAIGYLDTKTISARKVLRLTKQGNKEIGGTISTELPNRPLATILKHCMGTAAAPTGSGPYTHVFTPGDLTGKGLTIEVGRPASTGTVYSFVYAGSKVGSFTIAATQGDIATLALEVVSMSETVGGSLAAASYPTTWQPFTYVEGSVSIAGSPVGSVKSFTFTGNNAIERRFRIGSGSSKQPLETSLREYTGAVVTDLDATTHYALYTAGTQTAVQLKFDNGADSLTIDLNVMFTGETPELSGMELLEQNLPFRALSSTSDAAAVTITLINGDSTST